MRAWLHERLFRRPSREDSLRRRTRDAQHPSGPHLLDVSISSVKPYVNKAGRGEPLAPKKSPGSAPKLDEKATKPLEDDLRERPFVPPFGSAATIL
jgi:hypothetical protein